MRLAALNSTGSYSDRDTSLFEKEVSIREVQKDQVLLKQGEVAKSIFFIAKGAVYQFETKPSLERNIIDLHVENDWFFNQKSLAFQIPSEGTIVAFTDSVILELSINSMHALINQSSAFFQFNKLLAQPALRLYFFDNLLTPQDKYRYILDNKRQLLQLFPLKMIAAYLKITPETLSRVREKLATAPNRS
jgi:CRP-like cAMP-binding protein